ncbi:protein kinase [Diplocarpon rosae]|nr:protein kinase [Diplocarpon rosae]
MTSRFWASSEDLSVDSTVDCGILDVSHDPGSTESPQAASEGYQGSEARVNTTLDRSIGTIAHTGTDPSQLGFQPQYQSTILLLSMIEERCRTQAFNSFNATCHLADQLPHDHPRIRQLAKDTFIETINELVRIGMIPENFAVRQLSVLQSYLSSFDSVLKTIASRRASNIAGLEEISFNNSSSTPSRNPSSSQSKPESRALIKNNFKMVSVGIRKLPPFFAFFHPGGVEGSSESVAASIYKNEYEEICLLGSGGFGRVYLAVSKADRSIYAIKRITIPLKRLRQLSGRSDHEKMIAEIKRDRRQRKRASSRAQVIEESQDIVTFGESSSSPRNQEQTNDGKGGNVSGSTEDVPRFEELPGQLANLDTSDTEEEEDMNYHLYIKMTPYPLSLEDHIWDTAPEQAGKSVVKHCFHTQPAARLLLGILDGVEYLHRQKILHRDLKPANIFLAVLPTTEPTTPGYSDISDCKECEKQKSILRADQHIHVCPVIGDFGLIHELKDPQAEPFLSPTKTELQPFPFSQQAGTKFYCPPKVPEQNPICTRLDVYSLGVIAFELVYKFGTKSERHDVLSAMRNGVWPAEFESHKLAGGIKAMLHDDRDKRWESAQVREWLLEKLEEEK